MKQEKPMKILMLEDDEFECNRFKNYLKSKIDMELVFITASCNEAIQYIKYHNIDGIIVDIELHDGIGGSGLDFLTMLNKLQLDIKPIIIVTTNITSKRVHNIARRLGVDLIFCKTQKDYSPEMVVNTFNMLKEAVYVPTSIINETKLETKEDFRNRIINKINAELDIIGISHHLKGRKYIFEAIYFLIDNNDNETYYLDYLTKKYKRLASSISGSMQTCINNAWRSTSYEDLEKHFTAKISYKNGSPTPVEFIHYYVDKIKRYIS